MTQLPDFLPAVRPRTVVVSAAQVRRIERLMRVIFTLQVLNILTSATLAAYR